MVHLFDEPHLKKKMEGGTYLFTVKKQGTKS